MYKLIITAILALSSTLSYAAAVENLDRMLSKLNTFSAGFEQLILDNNGSRMQESYGQVDLKRPGLFRWKTEDPFPQLLVSDGETLWLFDQDLDQVTQQSVDKRLSNTPALLLNGDLDQLSSAFKVQGPETGDDGVFKLTPVDESALFVVMRIMFKDGIPMEMQMEDNLGQQTSVVFRDLRYNSELDDSLFSFVVPDGVDLIVE